MSTRTTCRKRGQARRSVRVAVPASAENPFLVVTLAIGTISTDYGVRPFPSEIGKAFEVAKISDSAATICSPYPVRVSFSTSVRIRLPMCQYSIVRAE